LEVFVFILLSNLKRKANVLFNVSVFQCFHFVQEKNPKPWQDKKHLLEQSEEQFKYRR